MGSQLAVFIDFENIALWAEQEFLDFELTAAGSVSAPTRLAGHQPGLW